MKNKVGGGFKNRRPPDLTQSRAFAREAHLGKKRNGEFMKFFAIALFLARFGGYSDREFVYILLLGAVVVIPAAIYAMKGNCDAPQPKVVAVDRVPVQVQVRVRSSKPRQGHPGSVTVEWGDVQYIVPITRRSGFFWTPFPTEVSKNEYVCRKKWRDAIYEVRNRVTNERFQTTLEKLVKQGIIQRKEVRAT